MALQILSLCTGVVPQVYSVAAHTVKGEVHG